MTQVLALHPVNPQRRLLRQVADILQANGIIVYPTDSCYALGCLIGNKDAVESMQRIRQLDKAHNFTLVCRDLSEISTYARVDKSTYRLLKMLTPGPYTFILKATHEVPRRLQHAKRKTIGIRVPDNTVAQALLEEISAPLLSTTLILPGDDLPLNDIDLIYQKLKHQVGVIIDGGNCGLEPTTVIDLSEDQPIIIRQGKGEAKFLASMDTADNLFTRNT